MFTNKTIVQSTGITRFGWSAPADGLCRRSFEYARERRRHRRAGRCRDGRYHRLGGGSSRLLARPSAARSA